MQLGRDDRAPSWRPLYGSLRSRLGDGRGQRIALTQNGGSVDVSHARPASLDRHFCDFKRSPGELLARDQFCDEVELSARVVGIGEFVFREELDRWIIDLVAVVLRKRRQRALVIDRRLLMEYLK